MMTRRIPYQGMEPSEVVEGVTQHHLRPAISGGILDMGCPFELVDLMRQCWDTNPSTRPSFPTIVRELKAIANEFKMDEEDDF